MHRHRRAALLPLLALLGCATPPPPKPPEPPPSLYDRTWELVGIRGGDGSLRVPAEPARYTLRLDASGRAALQADCNRASGGFTVEGPGISFSAFATTRAACPPGSLSDAYLQQFAFVRSYGFKDGRLFLVTLIDGTTLEFR